MFANVEINGFINNEKNSDQSRNEKNRYNHESLQVCLNISGMAEQLVRSK